MPVVCTCIARLYYDFIYFNMTNGFSVHLGGFVYVEDLLQQRQLHGMTVEDLHAVVENNNKKRFHMEQDPATGQLWIRANQGHSFEVHWFTCN